MKRIAVAAAAAVVSTAAAVRLILGHYPDEGPYWSVSATHGVHVGDVVIMVVWGLLMAVLWRVTRSGRARARERLPK